MTPRNRQPQTLETAPQRVVVMSGFALATLVLVLVLISLITVLTGAGFGYV